MIPKPGLLLRQPAFGSTRKRGQILVNPDFQDLHGDFTVTRSTVAGAWVDNDYTEFAINVPRFGAYEKGNPRVGLVAEMRSRINSTRNSTMVDAVVGTPGTLPTNAGIPNTATLTTDVVELGTVNGLSYIDLHIHGTTDASGLYQFGFESSTGIVAADAQIWTNSVYIAVVGGDLTNVLTAKLNIIENTSIGGFVKSNQGSDFQDLLTSSIQRIQQTITLSGGGTVARAYPLLLLTVAGTAAVDITIRLAGPQMERSAYANQGATTFIPTSTVAVSRAADVVDINSLDEKAWYNQLVGTFVGKALKANSSIGTFPRIFECGVTGGAEVLAIHGTSGDESNLLASIKDENVQVVNTQQNNADIEAVNNAGVAYELNNTGFSVNGVASAVDGSCTMPTVDTLVIGDQVPSFQQTFYGTILDLYYWPVRVTADQLDALTAYELPTVQDIVTSTALHDDATFTRTTTAKAWVDGVLTSFAINTPRFGLLVSDGAFSGFVTEPAAINVLTRSEQFGDAVWTKSQGGGAIVSTDAITAPDGTLTADKLIEDTGNGVHVIYQDYTIPGGGTYTGSYYVKAGERTKCALLAQGAGIANETIIFDLTLGTIVSGTGGTISGITSDGWYRITLTVATATVGQAASIKPGVVNDAGATSYVGDGTSGIYVWGSQFEATAAATSYITTTTASAARGVDVCTITDLPAKSWYRLYEGTVVADFQRDYDVASGKNSLVVNLNSNASANRIDAARQEEAGGSRVAYAGMTSGGADTSAITASTGDANIRIKMAHAFKVDDCASSVNGAAVGTDTSAAYPLGITQMEIGGVQFSAGNTVNGVIASVKYYPERVIDTKLVELST